MLHALRAAFLPTLLILVTAGWSWAEVNTPPAPKPDPAKTPAMLADVEAATKAATDAMDAAHKYSDIVWILTSSAFVMFMLPGLALFYGGMARRKNILGTMMHTMAALGIVGVQWAVIGYALAFGESQVKFTLPGSDAPASFIGFSPELVCLGSSAAIGITEDDLYAEKKIDKATATDEQKKQIEDELKKRNRFVKFPGTNLPLYLHAMFQGMFAIITVALISGAFAERVKFGSYLLFALLWTTLVYDPVAHWVWSFSWESGSAAGLLGANGAIDFAGGTVVHIAAGVSGFASILLLRKRYGYGKQTFHPSSMVLTLLGAGMLWFGWFGFNGGSALFSNAQAVSAFTVTQVAAATAGLAWLLIEWLHRGKPTALGFASGVVAGLVAITPASGYVDPTGALAIGAVAGVACYWAVALKTLLGYDDSLDAFGIHGVGGFIGAILTGVFVNLALWSYGAELPKDAFPGKLNDAKTAVDYAAQVKWQIIASVVSAIYAFVVTCVLVVLIDLTIGFTVSAKDEAIGLDLSQHGEVGMDFGPEVDGGAPVEPKPAITPPNGASGKRFNVVVEGPSPQQLIAAWSKLCQTTEAEPSKEFQAVYPYVTTVTGNKFRFRGGDPVVLKTQLQKLFTDALGGTPVSTHVES